MLFVPADAPPKHACCYCACNVADYHKNCHKFCVLPRGKDKKIRMFTKTEDRFCKEFCDIKRKKKANGV